LRSVGVSWLPLAESDMLCALRRILLILLASLCLSGCVQYDVGVHIINQTQGEIVQHIRLGEQLTNFSGSSAQDWLQSIQQRTRKLNGRTRRVSDRELIVRIPFNNGADLTARFNEFFQPAPRQTTETFAETGLPELKSELNLTQSNWLLVERDRLIFDLDLRPLGVLSANGNLLVSPGSLLDLKFELDTPWGARSVDDDSLAVLQQGKRLVWTLKPGAVNHLEAVFWLPSPLGIGTLAIVLLVLAGIYLRTLLFPQLERSTQHASPEI